MNCKNYFARKDLPGTEFSFGIKIMTSNINPNIPKKMHAIYRKLLRYF